MTMRRYQQLAYEQRCQIYALKKRGDSQREIAKSIGVSQSTVNRELTRNAGARGYRYKQAQEKATQRRKLATKATKMTPSMIDTIESKLRLEWSPEQISGWLESRQSLLAMKVFTFMYGPIKDQVVICIHIFAAKVKSMTNVVTGSRREDR